MHLHIVRIKRLIDTMNNCLAHGQKYLLKHGCYTILVLRNQLINQGDEVLQVSRLRNNNILITSVHKIISHFSYLAIFQHERNSHRDILEQLIPETDNHTMDVLPYTRM
jgi:hypothetical protein